MSSITLEFSPSFEKERKKFVKGNPKRFDDYAKAVRLLVSNPKHPSLNVEKLHNSPFWTIRLNKGDRIFFVWTSRTSVLLISIGKHDMYKRI